MITDKRQITLHLQEKCKQYLPIISLIISLIAIALQIFQYKDAEPRLTIHENIYSAYAFKDSSGERENTYWGILKLSLENNSNQPNQITTISFHYKNLEQTNYIDSAFIPVTGEYVDFLMPYYLKEEKLNYFKQANENRIIPVPIRLEAFSATNGYVIFSSLIAPVIQQQKQSKIKSTEASYIEGEIVIHTPRGDFKKPIRLYLR